jgi:hypothetical protein
MENKYYEVWIEGYAATGEHAPAYRLTHQGDPDTVWKGISFQQACVNALNELNWDMLSTMPQALGHSHYNPKTNSYWACRFFDNEEDARRSFG